MPTARSKDGYRAWLESEGTATVLIYSGLIIVLFPALHLLLRNVRTAAPDSLELRMVGAAFSVVCAAALVLVPYLRRYAFQIQLFNVVPCLLALIALTVNSGNNVYYVASALVGILALQQAFFRVRDMVFAFSLGLCFQLIYSSV